MRLNNKIFKFSLLKYLLLGFGCTSDNNFQELDEFSPYNSDTVVVSSAEVAERDKAMLEEDDIEDDDDDGLEYDDDYATLSDAISDHDEGDSEIRFMRDIAGVLVSRLADSMPLSYSSLPMMVTTPVLADDLVEKNAFSHYLQESLVSELHQGKFSVIDTNISDVLEYSKEGNFLLSRDWERLPDEVRVDLALVTTLMLNKRGLNISARVINIFSGRVVASALVYVNLSQISNYFSVSRIVTENKNDVLELDSSGERSIYIIGDKK